MRIIAYKTQFVENKVLVQESTGDTCLSSNIEELFSFLLEPYEDTIRICWDLDQTISVFLRLLGKVACRELKDTKKYRLGLYKVFYIPSKVWSLTHVSGLKCNLYDLSQYYPDLSDEPDVEGLQALGMKLLKELNRMGFRPTKLTSPVAIYEEAILSKLDLPKITDMPKEVASFAYECGSRLWVEAHCLGYFE